MSATFLGTSRALSRVVLTAALSRGALVMPTSCVRQPRPGEGGSARPRWRSGSGQVREARASGGAAATLCSTARRCKFSHEVQPRRLGDSEKYIVSPLSAISLAVVSVDLGPDVVNGKFQKETIHVVNCAPFCTVR